MNTTGCVLTGFGGTSGSATITWPAVAGTATNAVAFSNAISSAQGITAGANLVSGAANGVFVNGASGFKSGSNGRVNFDNTTFTSLGLTRFSFGTEASTNPAICPLSTLFVICDGAGTLTAGNTTILHAPGNSVFVTGDFTTAANTNLQTITGLVFNLPAVAEVYRYECDLTYSQGTGAAAVAFGIQAATNNPTNIYSTGIEQITVGPPATIVTGTLATLTTTTPTNIVSGTPGAQGTNYTVHLGGTIENPASANVINIMVSTATSGDAVTVRRGGGCSLLP